MSRKSKLGYWIVVIIGIIALMLLWPHRSWASSGQAIPSPYGSFYYTDKLGNEWICFYGERVNYSMGLDCERLDPCPCFSPECDISTNDETPVSTKTPDPTDVPKDTPKPTKVEKPKCNRGTGNGAENCDPGNSGGKPGKAGEDNE